MNILWGLKGINENVENQQQSRVLKWKEQGEIALGIVIVVTNMATLKEKKLFFRTTSLHYCIIDICVWNNQ